MKFQVGDLVYAMKNQVWGLKPVVIETIYHNSATCFHKDFGTGDFLLKDLRHATTVPKNRILKLKKLIKIEAQVDQLREELFGE